MDAQGVPEFAFETDERIQVEGRPEIRGKCELEEDVAGAPAGQAETAEREQGAERQV